MSALKLREAGYTNVTVLERGDDVGGTWNRNRYPGLACDVPSHGYSFSFNLNPDWTRSYVTQPEILAYMRDTVTKFDLWPMIRLNTGVASAQWNDATSEWNLITDQGETISADTIFSAQGMFGELKYPEIDGLSSFGGVALHTGAWPRDLDLTGKRVAVIGSAASAVQSIPEIAKDAAKLSVFQRSANWILPKVDVAHPPELIEQFRTDPVALQAHRDLLMDYVGLNAPFTNPATNAESEATGRLAIEVVEDPAVREKLQPTVQWGCMRPLFSNNYYETYNRDNVELITENINRVTENGVLTNDGVEHEVDIIVLATGYVVDKFASRIPITGRDGITLEDAWEDGAQAYFGISTTGFPNLFMLYGPNTNAGSLVPMIEYEADYAIALMQLMDDQEIAWIDVKREAMDEYNEVLQKAISDVEVWHSGCSHYYLSPTGRIVTQYPYSMFTYRDAVAQPSLEPFECSHS